MQKPRELTMICADLRLMRLDFQLSQGVEQCADTDATHHRLLQRLLVAAPWLRLSSFHDRPNDCQEAAALGLTCT
jgi:hypothetical protein